MQFCDNEQKLLYIKVYYVSHYYIVQNSYFLIFVVNLFQNIQAIALVDIVQSFNWTYISTVFSEGSYGKTYLLFAQNVMMFNGIILNFYDKLRSCYILNESW